MSVSFKRFELRASLRADLSLGSGRKQKLGMTDNNNPNTNYPKIKPAVGECWEKLILKGKSRTPKWKVLCDWTDEIWQQTGVQTNNNNQLQEIIQNLSQKQRQGHAQCVQKVCKTQS